MDFDNSDELSNSIREYLNRNKVKLWLPPFISNDNTPDQEKLKELAETFRPNINSDKDAILACLLKLQEKAVENVKKKSIFETTGVATLKIRSPNRSEHLHIDTELTVSGSHFKQLVAALLDTESPRLKIIIRGKVLIDDQTLLEQGIKHGMQVMALIIDESGQKLSQFESNHAFLDSTKKDLKTVRGSDNIQITDQSGRPLDLPKKEQKALMLAMTLHEKGRAAVKSENMDLALFLFLEAEKEFNQCNSNLLDQVDNYGLLSLDIAWCYLCLQSLGQLPDAEKRLKSCEQVFHKSYGENLERLLALKGTTCGEAVLFLRLHLLQAIVCYHQNKFEDSRSLLQRVEAELKGLKVDDEQLSTLINIGYSMQESRLALRESKGEISVAVNIIENKREERKRNAKEAEKERERKKLGKCMNGSWVEPQFHKALLSMGYSHAAAKFALQQANNLISDAVAWIQEHPEHLPLNACASMDGIANDRFDIPGPSSSDDGAFDRLAEGLSASDEDHLDLALSAEEQFLSRYKQLLEKQSQAQ